MVRATYLSTASAGVQEFRRGKDHRPRIDEAYHTPERSDDAFGDYCTPTGVSGPAQTH
jgi:hypothetical protein